MQFLTSHNLLTQNASEKRLVFFAKPTKGQGGAKPPKPPQPKAPTSEKSETDPNLKYAQEISQVKLEDIPDEAPKSKKKASGDSDTEKIAKLYQEGKIEGDSMLQLAELIKDPNKMKRKDCRYFVKALALGNIPGKAKYVNAFLSSLNTLEDGGEEQSHLEKVFRRLSDPTAGPLTDDRVAKEIAKLPELREKDIAEKTFKTTASRADIITTNADIHSAVETAAKLPETATNPNHLEGLTPEVPKEIFELRETYKANIKKAEQKTDEIEAAEKELETAFAAKDKTRISKFQARIENLRLELMELHKQVDLTYDELTEKETTYNEKVIARYRAFDKYAKEYGLNLMQTNRLKVWALDLANAADSGAIELKGFVTDKSGQTAKQMGNLTIKKITFDDRELDDSTKESEISFGLDRMHNAELKKAPGQIAVTYIDHEGNESTTDIKDFFEILKNLEAFEEIDSLESLSEVLAEENGEKEVEEGDEFTSALPNLPLVRVVKIDPEKQTVVLEDPRSPGMPLKKLDKNKLSAFTPAALYFDRFQREFTYGQFARFIRENGYGMEVPPEELPKRLAAQKKRLNRQTGAVDQELFPQESPAFDPPTIPGETKRVILKDEDGRLRMIDLTYDPANDDKNPWVADEIPFQEKGTEERPGKVLRPDFETMVAAGIPAGLASAQWAKARKRRAKIDPADKYPPSEAELNRPTWEKRRLGGRQLMQLANQGALANAPTKDQTYETDQSLVGPPSETETGGLAEETGESGPAEPTGKPQEKAKFYTEALPYDKVHKVGGLSTPEANYLKKVWKETRFLSVGDIWEMGKAMWEYYDRRFQRRQKDRYSSIGTQLPFFAPEMRRVNQSAETEQVNQFKESFEQKGVLEIWDRLNNTHNRDELKACFVVLASKGMIRWDDINMWNNINRFVGDDRKIPIPANGDPATILNEPKKGESPKTGKDFLKAAIDSLWGEGQYNDWYSQSKSSYQSNAQKYHEEGKELEGVPGGHGRRLATLLREHKAGIFVDPMEFEGLILHSILAGKSIMQEKIYFMIQGVAAQSPDGRTILSFDRMAHINSEMLVRFPILEYLCAAVPRPPDGEKHRFTIDDYREWAKYFDDGNPDNCTPTRKVDQFMWEKVIPSDETQNRINKAIRNAEMNMDHDDMFAYLPPSTVEVITDTCRAATGSKKFLTIEGYANAFPGFSQYLTSCSETGKLNKLREGIKSYVRFEGIMTDRYEKADKGYQRMGRSTLNNATICSETPPAAFISQINTAIEKIVEAYADPELTKIYNLMRTETPNFGVSEADNKLQKQVDLAFKQFNDVFDRVVKSDKGAKMASIVAGSGFEGMPWGVSAEELAKRKASFADKFSLE